MGLQEEFSKGMFEIQRDLKTAEHLLTVVYPVVKDSKLLLRAFENLYTGMRLNVSLILKLEYFLGKIKLSKEFSENFDVFCRRSAGAYGLDERDLKLLREAFYLGRKHKESGFEFSRHGKIVILDDDLGMHDLNPENLKGFLELEKRLLLNTNSHFANFR